MLILCDKCKGSLISTNSSIKIDYLSRTEIGVL